MTAELISQEEVWALFLRGSAKLILEEDTQETRCGWIRKVGRREVSDFWNGKRSLGLLNPASAFTDL